MHNHKGVIFCITLCAQCTPRRKEITLSVITLWKKEFQPVRLVPFLPRQYTRNYCEVFLRVAKVRLIPNLTLYSCLVYQNHIDYRLLF